MGQPRHIPILVTVDGAKQAEAPIRGLANAMDGLDKSSTKAATGGLKNAFDSTSNLKNEMHELGQDSEFVRNAMAALRSDVAKLTPNLNTAATGAGAVASGATSAGAGLGTMLNPISALVLALPLIIALFSTAAFGAVSLAKHAGEAGSKIHDLQQKTNFAAETLSTLSVGAKLSGSDIESLSGALNTFDKNIARANQSDTKLAKQLRDSNVDITNNERALRSIFKVLAQMPEGVKQVELANLAFGVSGRDMLGVIKETNGNIDLAMAKYAGLSLILSGDATKAADKFGDQLTILDLQIDAVKVRVGQQFMPVVLEVVQKISTYIKDNQQRWVEWARSAIESGRDIKTGAEVVGEAYATMHEHALSITPAFAFVDSSLHTSLGSILRYATGVGLATTALEKLGRVYNGFTKSTDPNAIPGQGIPNLAVPLQQGGFTTEQLQGFQKELAPFQNRLEAITSRVETFGQQSHVAAEMQFQLKNSVKELSPEVQDQAAKFNALALAQARQLDQLEATKKANDEAIKQAERVTQANENLRNEIDAVKLRTLQYGDAEGKTRSELERFNTALIRRKDQNLLDPKLIEAARKAYAGLDQTLARLAQNKAWDKLGQDRKEVANSLQSIRENISQAAAGALPDVEQRLAERDAILQRTARSIETISGLKIDRVQFAGLIDLFKSGPSAANLERALASLRKQLDPAVLENIAPKEISSIIELLFKAAEADRALLAAQLPLEQSTRRLRAELRELQEEVPIAAETAALRYQIAWQDANNAVALASDAAIVRQIQNQVALAHQMDVDFARLNDGVVDFLADQKTLQEAFQDVRTNSVRAFFEGIDSAIDRMTKRLGIAGDVLGTFLKDLAHLAASQWLQRLLGMGTGGTGFQMPSGGGGGGGGLFGFIQNLFGGGGRSGAPAMAHAMAAGGSGATSLLSGGAGMAGAGLGAAGGIAALLGGGGAAAAGAGAGMAGAGLGAGGAAAGGSSGMAALVPLLTNPITIAVAAAAVGGFLLWRHFRNGTEKKLREAIKTAYGVDIKDMQMLNQIKLMGESVFGKGNVGKHINEVIRLDQVKELINNYAESTGQQARGLATNAMFGDANFAQNQFIRPANPISVPRPAMAGAGADGGAFASSGRSQAGGIPAVLVAAVVGALNASAEASAQLVNKVKTMRSGEVLATAREENPEEFGAGLEEAINRDGNLGTRLGKKVGGQ